jgi:ketosteroid isomerase-like protein
MATIAPRHFMLTPITTESRVSSRRVGLRRAKGGNLSNGWPSLSRVPWVGLWNATGERLPPLFPRDTAQAMPEENVEVVRRAIDAYNRRDFDAIRAISEPEVELDWSASRGLEAGVYKGLEQVIGFYRNFLDTFEEVHIEPERFVESGDLVVVPNSAQIRGRDGIETVARSAFVFEIRGGYVARICLYQETAEALEAAGLPD